MTLVSYGERLAIRMVMYSFRETFAEDINDKVLEMPPLREII